MDPADTACREACRDVVPQKCHGLVDVTRPAMYIPHEAANHVFVSTLYSHMAMDQYLLIAFFNGMNIHLPAILMFTRGTRF